MRNIHTQSETIPSQINGTYPPTTDQLLAAGYRLTPDVPPVADGYTRVSIRLVEGDGVTGQWEVVDRPTADIEAEAAAAESARKATPIVYDQPLETPMVSLLSHDAGKGVGIVATDDGNIATVIVHESPWPDADALKAKVDAAIAKRNTLTANGKAGINGQLQTRIENIERALGWRE
jgi:hypothetical protein